ncbi:hypothetical protein, partial [Klebsiella aerogenes]|uniref:hypothetical protein n=1 Tax=Klebsiella aerogenes TaxID=548 RepID=UPI001F49E0EF
LEPRRPIVAQSPARYWLNLPGISLLIDLNTLLNSLNEKKTFKRSCNGGAMIPWSRDAPSSHKAPHATG